MQNLKTEVLKTYSERMNGCRDSATEDRKTSRFRLCPKSKACRWTTHFVQTIPSAGLRDIPGALSFTTLLPKSPGQLLHPLRKVLQAFRFLKSTRCEAPELNSRKAILRVSLTVECISKSSPLPYIFIKMLLNEIDELFMENFVIFV